MSRPGRSVVITSAASLLAIAVMGAGSFSCGEEESKEGTMTIALERPSNEGPGAPDPDGNYSLRCNDLLGNFTEGSRGYRFVAGGRLKNTGNVGILTEVTARWELLGARPASVTEEVKLEIGEHRSVQMTLPATQGEIDAHREAGSHCKTNVKIVDTFGKPE